MAAPGTGWQHGPVPRPPDGLTAATRAAWRTWFTSWVAGHWGPGDLPGLRKIAQLYDAMERGELQRAAELRLWSAEFGLTPGGQQDRRWLRPGVSAAERVDGVKPENPYGHLRVVAE